MSSSQRNTLYHGRNERTSTSGCLLSNCNNTRDAKCSPIRHVTKWCRLHSSLAFCSKDATDYLHINRADQKCCSNAEKNQSIANSLIIHLSHANLIDFKKKGKCTAAFVQLDAKVAALFSLLNLALSFSDSLMNIRIHLELRKYPETVSGSKSIKQLKKVIICL